MKTFLLIVYFFPLCTWWFLVLLDRMKKDKEVDEQTPTISFFLNIASFVPILNWFIVLELFKKILEKARKIIDD